MRNLSAAALAEAQRQYGSEPVMVVGIKWDAVHEVLYADRDMDGAIGRIVELTPLESIIKLDGSGSGGTVSATILDPDGQIKAIMDRADIHRRPFTIYQAFFSLPLAERFVVWEGAVATPVEWDEGRRTLSISATPAPIPAAIGFSLEDGMVDFVHQDLIGVGWPMIFGRPQHVPMLQLQEIPQGQTTKAFGVWDRTIPLQIQKLQLQLIGISGDIITVAGGGTEQDLEAAEAEAGSIAQQLKQQQDEIIQDISRLEEIMEDQKQWEIPAAHMEVIGGWRFPKGGLVKINELLFHLTWQDADPPTFADQARPCRLVYQPLPLQYVDGQPIIKEGFNFIQAGSQVQLIDRDFPITYVASITPGALQAVYAYRDANGTRRLTQVPQEYYTTGSISLPHGLSATTVTLKAPLSTVSFFDNLKTTRAEELAQALAEERNTDRPSHVVKKIDWGDDLYAEFVGSLTNPADIIAWALTTFTSLPIDSDSFGVAHNYLTAYPANFAMTDRPGTQEFVNSVAYQSRCAVWIENGRYKIKYLPATTVPVATITWDSIEANTLVLTTTETEDIVTRYTATFKHDYAFDDSRRLVLRSNDAKYGLVDFSYNFTIYDNVGPVVKTATYWLIQKSNTWKVLKFKTFLDMLPVETFDMVTIDLPGVASNDPVDGIVESAVYDSASNSIEMVVRLPIRFGEMVPYPFAYPQAISSALSFPQHSDLSATSGGDFVSRHFVDTSQYNGLGTVYTFSSGQDNGINVDPYDYAYPAGQPIALGDPHPSDQGDHNRTMVYSYQPVAFQNEPRYDYIYRDYPKINPEDTAIGVWVGKITGGEGKLYNVDIYKKGLDGEATSLEKVAEAYQSTNLKLLPGEKVLVIKSKDKDGKDQYQFVATSGVSFPLKTKFGGVTADLYLQGKDGSFIEGEPIQIPQVDDDTLPADTWAIGVRTMLNDTVVYTIQPAVWLLDDTPGEPEDFL